MSAVAEAIADAAGILMEEDEDAGKIPARLAALRTALKDSAGLDDIPDPEPLLDGILFRDGLAWLQGKPGHGKSFVGLDWAGCIAGGVPWQRHEVITQGPVLYLIAEGVTGMRQRVRAWEARAGVRMIGVHFLPVAVQLLDEVDLIAFCELVTEIAPVLVVIDTQARVTVGAEENSAKDMGRLVAAADRVRLASRACVLLVHHEARAGENMRGSTALEGAATTIVRVFKDGPHVRLECRKQKDAPEFDPFLLQLVEYGPSAVLSSQNEVRRTAETTKSEDRILEVMRDAFETTGATPTQLTEVSGIARASVYRAVNGLVIKGMLINSGTDKRPFYVLSNRAA